MDLKRSLIVNADDFGLSEGVNRGIIEAHERGIVTSASLMVLRPAAALAAAYGRERPRLGLGLHIDLGEWAYNGEEWVLVYQLVPLEDHAVLAEELERQLGEFRRLVGCDPTHFDSHQHVHQDEPVRSATLELARGLDVPVRHFSANIRYCGRFHGQTARGLPLPEMISVESLIAIVTDLPPGVTELGCHPGREIGTESPYGPERSAEVDVLCDGRVRAQLEAQGIELRSFRDARDLVERDRETEDRARHDRGTHA